MQIINSNLEDLDNIFELYRGAIAYQKAKGYNLWNEFDRKLITEEIKDKRNWKIVIDGQIACMFSVVYSDPLLWAEQDNDFSIYLHRITTNKVFKGRSLMKVIVEWAKQHCKETGRKFIRMDTWADNKNLTDYYIGIGFKVIGYRHLDKDAKGLPSHYSTLSLVLFEMRA
jgi:hypothetical protein